MYNIQALNYNVILWKYFINMISGFTFTFLNIFQIFLYIAIENKRLTQRPKWRRRRLRRWILRIGYQNLPRNLALSIGCLHINCSLCQPAPDIVTRKRESLFGRKREPCNDLQRSGGSWLFISCPPFVDVTYSYLGSNVCRFFKSSLLRGAS